MQDHGDGGDDKIAGSGRLLCAMGALDVVKLDIFLAGTVLDALFVFCKRPRQHGVDIELAHHVVHLFSAASELIQNTAQHGVALGQHGTAQHSTAQHRAAQHGAAVRPRVAGCGPSSHWRGKRRGC